MIAAQGIPILSMYISFMQEVLGVSPVTFEEWLFFLMIALVLIAMMEVYKFAGKFRNR
ncbi:MAG: cation transporting ATPase C-terminal domain-containing protein [Methanomicrobiaceae archaeon]|nr:cation transporting ATPase C-terminal domain-containing protein [Methanomicrobiaceae archaeon]